MGTKGQTSGGRLEVSKRNYVVLSEWTYLEETPLVSPKVAVGKEQKLAHASRRLSEPCHNRCLFVSSLGQVECVRVVSGAVAAHAQTMKTDAGTEEKVAGWSMKVLEQVPNRQQSEDAEEMMQWRTISQEGVK